MSVPGWWSQKFRPDGGIAAEGLRNQLGRPSMSVLSVLVREAAQNSWDARLEQGDVRFELALGELDVTTRAAWKSALGPGAPQVPALETELRPLADYLDDPAPRYLAVSDRGAVGLGGPTRSDEPAAPGKRAWLSFVLNSGERRDVEGGGGTYGFGKGAFFRASRVGTVVIYTRFRGADGVVRSRLIGSALLGQVDEAEPPLTGRHWWGCPADDYCEPLEDVWAVASAEALGLPGFEGDETGTTVVVLDPDLSVPQGGEGDEMSLDEAGAFLAEAAAFNLWPIAMHGRRQRMRLDVTVNGRDVAVPDESTDEVIRAFTEAYRKATSTEGSPVECLRPKVHLGAIAHEPVIQLGQRGRACAELGLPTDQAPHHVALLRAADLVVRYVPGPERPDPTFGYAGVFRADDDVDYVFAAAEPPTHDDWVPDQLPKREATLVRVARKRIDEYCRDQAAGLVRSTRARSGGSVGRVSRRLGFLMDVVANESGGVDALSGATGAGSASGGSGSSGGGSAEGRASAGKRHTRVRLDGQPYFTEHAGRVVLAQKVDVREDARVRAGVQVVTPEGAEQRSPVAAPNPEVLGWLLPDGSVLGGAEADLPAGVATLLILPVEDAALEFTVGAV